MFFAKKYLFKTTDNDLERKVEVLLSFLKKGEIEKFERKFADFSIKICELIEKDKISARAADFYFFTPLEVEISEKFKDFSLSPYVKEILKEAQFLHHYSDPHYKICLLYTSPSPRDRG